MITVTTPSGTTRQSTFSQLPLRELSGLPPPPMVAPGLPPPAYTLGNVLPPHANGGISRSITPHAYPLPHPPIPYEGTYSPGFPGTSPSRNAVALLGNLNNNSSADYQTNGEFNHAIQYLNEIKARYADDPNAYKQFLEILQTRHKEQRQMQDVGAKQC